MANEVEFKLKIKTDGKDTFHDLTVDAESFDSAVKRVTETARKASDEIQNMAMKNLNWDMFINATDQLNSSIQSLAGGYDSFDKSMRAVNTMAGKTGKDLDSLTDSVKELSKNIPMAREELAGGLYQVISNGVPEDNWISFLEQSSKAAVGGIADLGQTVTVTSTIIKNYGLEWDTAGSIQDKIQKTAKNGVTSFEQLAAALPRVSGSASQLGISIDELMAVFATTTGVTGNTAEVSTQLAAVLTALIKPSSEAGKAAEAMGISFNAASIKEAGGLENFLRSLDTTITEYSARTGELKETIYSNLFGSAEALRVLTSLTGEQKEKFSQNIREMADSTGTIEQAFGEMAETGDAENQMLRNKTAAYTDLIASVASMAAPYASLAADTGIAIANGIRLTQTMKVMKSGLLATSFATKTAAVATTAFSTTLTGAKRALYIYQMQVITARAAITSTTGAVRLMNIAIAASPYLIAAAAAAALATGIYKICTSSGKTEEAQKRLNDTLGEMNTEVAKERLSLDAMFEPLNRAKTGTDEWKKAKDAILSKYGSYLEKIGVEIDNVNTARIAYNKLSEAILNTARARAMEKATSEAGESFAGIEGNALKNIREQLYKGIGQGAGKITAVQAGKAWAQIREAVLSGKDIPQEAREILAEMQTSYTDRTGTHIINPTAGYIYRMVNEVRNARAVYDKEIANAKAMFGRSTEALIGGESVGGDHAEGSGNDNQKENAKAVDIIRMSYTELEAAITRTESSLKKLAPTETADINRLSIYNKQLKARKELLDKQFGLGGSKGGSNDTAALGSLAALESRLNELKTKQMNAPVEIQLTFTQDIVQLEQVIVGIKDRLERAKFEARYTLKPVGLGGASDNPIKNAMQASLGEGGVLEGFKIEPPEMDLEKPLSGMEAWNAAVDAAREKNAEAIGSMGAMSSAMGSLGNLIGGQAGAWMDWAGNLLGAIAQALPQLAALATANTAAAATGAASSVAGIPFAGPVMAVAAVASVLAALANLPKFANGGIAYGPTLGLFGEYAGASNNPEVVAPLNRLKQLIQPVDGIGGGRVEFTIDGRTLKGVLNKVDNFNSRTR